MRHIQIEWRIAGRVCLCDRDLPIFEHGIDHQIAPAQRVVSMVDGRIIKRRLRQSCNQGSFRKSELPGRFAEVIFRRSFESINSVAEINLIGVESENLLFGKSALDLYRQQSFLDLAMK